jgi:SAM-dependent methyltransferase
MPPKIPERLIWAVDQLDPRPTDAVLEIGCGNGAAAQLILHRLTSGHLTAIDRSAGAIAKAEQRNQAQVAAGKARFFTATLAGADLPSASFNCALAVNVNVLWQSPAAELRVLRRVLRPGGRLCLVYQPPSAEKAEQIAEACRRHLLENGFGEPRVAFTDFRDGRGVCITAQ